MDSFSFEEDDEDSYYVRKKPLKHKGDYKVCEGCEQILLKYIHTCPFCKAYRFSTDEQRIIDACCSFKLRFKEMLDWESEY